MSTPTQQLISLFHAEGYEVEETEFTFEYAGMEISKELFNPCVIRSRNEISHLTEEWKSDCKTTGPHVAYEYMSPYDLFQNAF